MSSTRKVGDEYEDACANIFRNLMIGGELLLDYCRVPFRHRIVLPTEIERKRKILGGRSERLIETDITFKFIDEKTRRVTPVIVECKYHKDAIDVGVFNKFAYDLLDIRANPDFGDSVGIMFAKTGFQEGAKLVAKSDYIGIAVFDHLILGSQLSFVTEEVSLSEKLQDRPDLVFKGALAFGNFHGNFEDVIEFLNQFGLEASEASSRLVKTTDIDEANGA